MGIRDSREDDRLVYYTLATILTIGAAICWGVAITIDDGSFWVNTIVLTIAAICFLLCGRRAQVVARERKEKRHYKR